MTQTPESARPRRSLYLGLFLITMATLLFELGLTRIFSVVMYFHMAFFAVSVTLFGMAFGGVIVHFLPRVFTVERAQLWMARSALAFSATTIGALAALLAIRFDLTSNTKLIGQICVVSVALAVPFTFSGVAVALALTRFPRKTNLMYGFDLAGAALGCLLFAPFMTALGGPGFILMVALAVAVAGVVLMLGLDPAEHTVGLVASFVILAAATLLVVKRDNFEAFKLRYIRGAEMDPKAFAFEGWNAISRVTVYPDRGNAEGVAPVFYKQALADQQTILIDTFAATPILKFDGRNFDQVFYPFHDISYLVHVVKKNASMAIIGVGGGRDVLAARCWGQPDIEGIEINSRVREALVDKFNDYAGRPTDWPGVKMYLDEARSHIARSGKQYDIIQASLIDTFAATAAGAFVLTENALYTTDGWNMFFDHLKPDGILTMSRWYTEGMPVESIRLVALARATLESRGMKDAQKHILMARTPQPVNRAAQPVATICVKNTPFTDAEVDAFEKWTAENQLIPLVSPRRIYAAEMEGMLTAPDMMAYARAYPFDLTPPTDSRPFFFDVLRWRDIFKPEFRQGGEYIKTINLKPLIMLGTLLATVTIMAFCLVVIPLLIQGRMRGRQTSPLGKRLGMMLFFIMLGLAYLTIELTLMQRFTVFLGHPSYSLTVCLFTMLLASGLGSMAAPRLFPMRTDADAPRRLTQLSLTIVLIQVLTLFVALYVMGNFVAASTPMRVFLTAAVIFPMAFLMGMPFPLAVQAASRTPDAPLAWYWGLNGAFSVCASVLVVTLAHTIGLTWAFLCGSACYLIAAFAGRAFGTAEEKRDLEPDPALAATRS
ncbi:MAG: hypothetical protein ABFD69_15645 [Candidatus Sumerlaeia bacterium]